MLTDGYLPVHSLSMLGEFDRRLPKHYPLDVAKKVRKQVSVPQEMIEAAKSREVSLSDYVAQLHFNQRSARVAYVASVYRGFALLEMARLPVDPSYFDLVDGVLGEVTGREFRLEAGSGNPGALAKASAELLGADTRASAVEAVLVAAQRAQVLHEGFIEAARLLEATYYR
ncbi:MAG: hypothetical protein AAGK14_12790 [Verrucomicrobiota bacterium]